MGNFYTSIAIKTKDLDPVVDFLKKKRRISFVSKPNNAFIYLYDEKCDQDPKQINQLCKKISLDNKCPVMAFNNHDDDLLNYWLFVNGEKVDQYDSAPGYFQFKEVKPPRGGDPGKLCSVFDCQEGVEKLGDILRKENSENDSYFLASERHKAICVILGLNFQLSALSFNSIDIGGSENAGDFIKIGDTPAAQFKRELQRAELEKELFKKEGLLLDELIDYNEISAHTGWYPTPVWSFCPKTGRLYVAFPDHSKKYGDTLYYFEQNKEQTLHPTSLTLANTVYKFKIDNSGKYLALDHVHPVCKSELLDFDSGELLLTIQHNAMSDVVCFNNDSTRFYCLSDFLVCSALPNMQIINKIPVPRSRPRCMALHPSGKYAAVGYMGEFLVVDLVSFSIHPILHLGIIQDCDAEPYSNFFNAFQTIHAELPPAPSDCILQKLRTSDAILDSLVFSPGGSQLYMGSSKGVWIYNWADFLSPTINKPEPIKVYTFLELLTDRILGYDLPGKIGILQNYDTLDVCFDANRNLLLYSNINGTICYIDIKNKSQGILVECPGNPRITKLEISPDGRLLVCVNWFKEPGCPNVPQSLQIWNYQELLKKANLF